MLSKTFTIKFAGPAGLGIKSVGQILSKSLIKHGFNLIDYSEYPSLVRGGHNTYQVTFSSKKVYSTYFLVDLFLSLSPNHWQNHLNEFSKDTLVFSEEEFVEPTNGKFLRLPLKELITRLDNSLATNIIALGVICFIYNLKPQIFKDTIITDFAKNTEGNLAAFDLGYEYAKDNLKGYQKNIKLPKNLGKLSHNFNDGNESFGWGFLKGGGNFYTAYPMTPATGAMHFLAQKQEEYSVKVFHAEDEIAAANIAAGAAITGARAATGTSGGGFALMNEAISFCGVAEIGMVYYLVSRPGPATGLPTWTAQADLMHAIYSGHGEFPKVVLAPGDQDESFDFAVDSLNLAAKLQTPVIVVSDKLIGESSSTTRDLSKTKVKVDKGQVVDKPKTDFKRYSLTTKTGISPLTIPGTSGGEFLSNSYEHDEFGFSTEDASLSESMSQKRLNKLKTALNLVPKPVIYGNENAKKLIIGWGSVKGPILEALKSIKNPQDYAFIQIRTIWPINPDLKNIFKNFKNIIVIENNQTNQLVTLLKSQFDFNPTKIISKNDGRPYFPEDILKILEIRN